MAGGVPGRHRDPVQIMSQHDRPPERRRRLRGEPLTVVVLVALREMGEHEQPRPGLGRDAAGLPGGQVPVLVGQRGLGVGEGRFAHHHVRAVSELERGIAQPGIHDEREPLAPPRLAHLLHRDQALTGDQAALALQPPDVGAGNAEGGEPVREHPPPVRLD